MSSPLRPDRFGSGFTGVALAYVAGAWVLLQVVETFDSLVGLPEVLVRGALVLLLVGLPIVLTTAWVQLRIGGLERLRHRRLLQLFTWRNALGGGVLALAAWGGVAAVWLITGPPRGVGTDGGAEDAADPRVLAVLPFQNLLPGAAEQEWLVSGLHEQVIHELSRVPGLRVISRTSVLPYADEDLAVPEIARRLGADAVLEGSVRGDGQRLRATMQLIDAATDHHEWSEEYDAALDDLIEVQERIARRVAATFRTSTTSAASLPESGRTSADPEALRRYLQGRYLWKNLGAPPGERALGLFRQAVEIDPDFALAWASLAEAWLAAGHFGVPPREAFPRADSAAVQALSRVPDLPEAHIALADARFHFEWNWDAAERGFRRGLELNPSHATGHWWFAGLLAALDRTDEAEHHLGRARMLDPAASIGYAFGARVLYWGGRYEAAREQARQALELEPDHFYAHGALGFIHLQQGRPEAAVAAFQRSVAISPKFLPGLVLAQARAGRVEEARSTLARLEAAAAERYVSAYERSFAYLGLGEREHALDLLEQAVGDRDAELIWIGVEPALAPLHDEPRFRAVLQEMGLAT